jgi:hypothetical protein
MEARHRADREKDSMGIFQGDINQKKSKFDSQSDPRALLLKAQISRALAQTLRSQIGALPETKPWSLLTAAMQAEEAKAANTNTGFGNRAGPKKIHENMNVSIRIRPPTSAEMKGNAARVVSTCSVPSSRSSHLTEHRVVVLDPQMTEELGVDQLAHAVSKNPNTTFPRNIASIFKFDHCFWSPLPGVSMPAVNEKGHVFATQQDIYSSSGEHVVENALNGISSTNFVYGPRGTGKSYTMFGDMKGGMKHDSECIGLLPRVYSEIVERIAAGHSHDTKCQLSMLEIYNEKVVDLLQFTHSQYDAKGHKNDHKRDLKIREHPILGPYADGMRKVTVSTKADVLGLVNEVLDRRQNEESWMPRRDYKTRRSNATLLCTLEITPNVIKSLSRVDPFDPNQAHSIRVHMVDLAGGGASVESVDTWRTSVRTGSRASMMKPLKVADVSMSGNLHKSNRLGSEVIKESACAPDANSNINVLAEHEKRDFAAARRSQSHLNYILHCLERGFDMRSLPFRDSVLTWLLRVALTAPNSSINLLTSISPAEGHYEETMHVLKYSERLWSARRMRRFGHMSPTRPQRSGTLLSETGTSDMNDDATVNTQTSVRSDLLSSIANHSISGTRFRGHGMRSTTGLHSIRQERGAEKPEWQKYLRSSPPRNKSGSSRGRSGSSASQKQMRSSAPLSRSSSVGPTNRKGVASTMGVRGRDANTLELEMELQSVRAERDAVLHKLEGFTPSVAINSDTPDGVIMQLTAKLCETEAELRALKTVKESVERGEQAMKAGEQHAQQLAQTVQAVVQSLKQQGGGGDTSESESQELKLKDQLADALSSATKASAELVAYQKQTQEEFTSLWQVVQTLNDHQATKDDALVKLAAENKRLQQSLQKEKSRVKELDSEIELLDQALMQAVEDGSPDKRQIPNKDATAISAISLEVTHQDMSSASAGGAGSFTHAVASSPYTPEPTSRVSKGGAATTGGKQGGGLRSATRPFSKTTTAPSSATNPPVSSTANGAGAASTTGSSGGGDSGDAGLRSVDETLQALGRFLVHDTQALSMQKASRQSRTPPPSK